MLPYGSEIVGQYDVPALLSVPSTPVMSYYSGLILNDPGDEDTRLWTIALTEDIFFARVTLVINA